jgi:hypothetical protein
MINDTFKRIQVRAMACVQNTSTSTTNANDLLPKVKDWVRTRYDRILRNFPWGELNRSYNLPIISGTRDYSLRYDLEDVIKMWDTTNGKEITALDIRDHVRFNAVSLEVVGNVQTGTADHYIPIGSKSCSALLSVADKVQVLSTSASDVAPCIVRITGEVSGMTVSEDITLTGATAVDSANTYDASSELQIAQGSSSATLTDAVGVITVREKTTATNILAKLSPSDRSPLFKWIRLSLMPSANATFQVWYKKRWLPLVNDNDAPIIPCANELVEGVVADALWEDGQVTGAQDQEQKFANSVKELWIAMRPRNLIKQIVPDNGEPQVYGQRNLYNLGNSY